MARYDIDTATYPIDEATYDAVVDRFTYHAPKEGQPERYGALRSKAKSMALMITGECPPSVERDLALAKLDSVVMHANAAIARHE